MGSTLTTNWASSSVGSESAPHFNMSLWSWVRALTEAKEKGMGHAPIACEWDHPSSEWARGWGLYSGRALVTWGGSSTRNLHQSIASCKQKMAQLKGKRDVKSLEEFELTKQRYVDLLIQNETFWKQRTKQFWLTAGDANT